MDEVFCSDQISIYQQVLHVSDDNNCSFDNHQLSHRQTLLAPNLVNDKTVSQEEHFEENNLVSNPLYIDLNTYEFYQTYQNHVENMKSEHDLRSEIMDSHVNPCSFQLDGTFASLQPVNPYDPKLDINWLSLLPDNKALEARPIYQEPQKRISYNNFDAAVITNNNWNFQQQTELQTRCRFQDYNSNSESSQTTSDLGEDMVKRVKKIKVHQQQVKATVGSEESKQKEYKCKYCEKVFVLPIALLQHVKSHMEYHSFVCNQCGKRYLTQHQLNKHQEEHLLDTNPDPKSKKKIHYCSYCDKTFNRVRNLVLHTRTHTGEKPCQCESCGKFFTSNMALAAHKKSHTGNYAHGCSYCPKRFATPSTLRAHERTHTGERPFKCTFCDKSYSQMIGLTVHTRFHTGERPYLCLFCDRRFALGSFLNAHVRKAH